MLNVKENFYAIYTVPYVNTFDNVHISKYALYCVIYVSRVSKSLDNFVEVM